MTKKLNFFKKYDAYNHTGDTDNSVYTSNASSHILIVSMKNKPNFYLSNQGLSLLTQSPRILQEPTQTQSLSNIRNTLASTLILPFISLFLLCASNMPNEASSA